MFLVLREGRFLLGVGRGQLDTRFSAPARPLAPVLAGGRGGFAAGHLQGHGSVCQAVATSLLPVCCTSKGGEILT